MIVETSTKILFQLLAGLVSLGDGRRHYVILPGQHFLGLPYLLGHGHAQLRYELAYLAPVDHYIVAERHGFARIDQQFDPVDNAVDIYDDPLSRRFRLRVNGYRCGS